MSTSQIPESRVTVAPCIVFRLREPLVGASRSLRDLADELGLTSLSDFLASHPGFVIEPVVQSLEREALLELELRASETDFKPRHSLASYWRICGTDRSDESMLEALRLIPSVQMAYFERRASDPAVNPIDDGYSQKQGYLNAAPEGVDARWAWKQPYAKGSGVKVVDLEQGWILEHEDLPKPKLLYNDNLAASASHGAAVLGEIAGVDNDFGIVGISPGVRADVVSYFNKGKPESGSVPDSICAALQYLDPGDVLLLEVEYCFEESGVFTCMPVEIEEPDLDAIRLASAQGVIVVEAAGNGNRNLDEWVDAHGHQRMNRNGNNFVDSGATIVGAARSSVSLGGHDRMPSSNWGGRVDCYAWGENIVTAGGGYLGNGADLNSLYTDRFGGTSGAAPMVAAVAAIAQENSRAVAASTLSAVPMRTLLSDPDHGTPQGKGMAGSIGVMPDLKKLLSLGLGACRSTEGPA